MAAVDIIFYLACGAFPFPAAVAINNWYARKLDEAYERGYVRGYGHGERRMKPERTP